MSKNVNMNITPGKTTAIWWSATGKQTVTLISKPDEHGKMCIRTADGKRHVVNAIVLQFGGTP